MLQGGFFSAPPPLIQAHYKFLYLRNFGGGQFNLHRAWDLVKLEGGQNKKPPCRYKLLPNINMNILEAFSF